VVKSRSSNAGQEVVQMIADALGTQNSVTQTRWEKGGKGVLVGADVGFPDQGKL
jgi:hypothetical protein